MCAHSETILDNRRTYFSTKKGKSPINLPLRETIVNIQQIRFEHVLHFRVMTTSHNFSEESILIGRQYEWQ